MQCTADATTDRRKPPKYYSLLYTSLRNQYKFAGPWPRACQITGLWILTMSNILFLQVSSQTGQFGNQKSTLSRHNQHRTEKVNIEQQLLQLLLLLLLLLLKLFLVPGARGGCQGASGSSDRHSNLRRVTFFLHLFLGILRLLIFSYFVQNWSPNSSQNGVHF